MATSFPEQLQRLLALPLDVDSVFHTQSAMTAYLTSPRRYAGQLAVSVFGDEPGLWVLSAARDAWVPAGASFDNVALTGVPTAPDLTVGSPSNQLSNRKYVDDRITEVVGSPTALTTLNSLKEALDSDSSATAAILAQVDAKAPLVHTHDSASTSAAGFATAAMVTKLNGIEAGAQANTVASVNGQTGAVSITAAGLGLGNVQNTADADKPISDAVQAALDGISAAATIPLATASVDGRMSSSMVTKLNGIAAGATATAVSTAAPLMDGTAAAGSTGSVADGGHRHPTDTSRAAASALTSHAALAATTSAAGHMTAEMVTKLTGIAAGAQVNAVTSVNGQVGDVVISGGTAVAVVPVTVTLLVANWVGVTYTATFTAVGEVVELGMPVPVTDANYAAIAAAGLRISATTATTVTFSATTVPAVDLTLALKGVTV